MQRKHNARFNETIVNFQIANRLKVIVIEKPRFHKTYVTLSVPFGSIHRHYIENNTLHTVPGGAAHFLEHKLFEVDGSDISRFFTLNEASINAYTEHNRTTYLFSATNHIIENIYKLLDICFHPVFTSEGVKKEKNIILEELDMHRANPYYTQYQTILNQLFHHHPIKDDILGDENSIESIDDRVLASIHKAFYKPENAYLVIVGNQPTERLYQALSKYSNLPLPSDFLPHCDEIHEPNDIVEAHKQIALDVMIPSVLLGIKLMPENTHPLTRIRESFAISMFMDLAFGKSSHTHEVLLQENLINDSYGIDIQIEQEFGYILLGSETLVPHELEKRLIHMMENLDSLLFEETDFLRIKKQLVGSFVMALDSMEYMAQEIDKYAQYDIDLFDLLDLAHSISYDEILACKKRLSKEQQATLIVLSKTEE